MDRRLLFFEISYIHYDISLQTVQADVRKELNEPGKLLGYRALNLKLSMQHEVQVPRNLVNKILQNEDPEGLEFRCPSSKKKEVKDLFSCDGPLNVVSLHVHEKLCGYQNWTSHWVCMDVLKVIPERYNFCASATCGKKDWKLNIRGLGRVSRTMCVLIFFVLYIEQASRDLMNKECSKFDIKF